MSTEESDLWSNLPSIDQDKDGALSELTVYGRARAYQRYNQSRLEMVRERLPQNTRMAFDVLPILIHNPSTGMPGGSLREGTPNGIVNFETNGEMAKAVKKLFPDSPWPPGAVLTRPVIFSMLALGSMGTVAQTRLSDLDVWLVTDDRITGTDNEELLHDRLREVEHWAMLQGIEVHFFPRSISQVQQNDFGKLGGESAGSALRSMLKEEFYRTHLLLQGQAPLWWIVAPEADLAEYQRTAMLLRKIRSLRADDYIDLGHVTSIPKDEFLGACLWQMVKSLQRPFKSLLKMTLVARQLEFENPPLLSEQLKKRIFAQAEEGQLDADPYLIMVDTLAWEYDRAGDTDTARLLRQSFYLQIFASEAGGSMSPMTKEMLSNIAQRWGWTQQDLAHLERFQHWTVHEIVRLGDFIENYMDGILDRLYQRLGSQGQQSIREADLILLDRKIRGARSKHERQVRLLSTAFFPGDLTQGKLVFRKNPDGWQVLPGDSPEPLLSQAPDLGSALAFTVTNGLFGKKTSIRMDKAGDLDLLAVRRRLDRMQKIFSGARPEKVPVDLFGSEPESMRILVECVTQGRSSSSATGSQLLSQQWDLLEYSAQGFCMIDELIAWTVTSWGTVVRNTYEGPTGIVRAMTDFVCQKNHQGKPVIEFLSEKGFEDAGSRRVVLLFRAINDFFDAAAGGQEYVFLFRPSGINYLFVRQNEVVQLVGPLSDSQLQLFLAKLPPAGRTLQIDKGAVKLGFLMEAFRRTPPGTEATYLFQGLPFAGYVYIGTDQAVCWGGRSYSEGAFLMRQHDPSGAVTKVVLSMDRAGNWAIIDAPATQTIRPDILVTGQIERPEQASFAVVTAPGQSTRSAEEAVTWHLGQQGIAPDRPPVVVLGEVRADGRKPTITERFLFRKMAADRLEVTFRGMRHKNPS